MGKKFGYSDWTLVQIEHQGFSVQLTKVVGHRNQILDTSPRTKNSVSWIEKLLYSIDDVIRSNCRQSPIKMMTKMAASNFCRPQKFDVDGAHQSPFDRKLMETWACIQAQGRIYLLSAHGPLVFYRPLLIRFETLIQTIKFTHHRVYSCCWAHFLWKPCQH